MSRAPTPSVWSPPSSANSFDSRKPTLSSSSSTAHSPPLRTRLFTTSSAASRSTMSLWWITARRRRGGRVCSCTHVSSLFLTTSNEQQATNNSNEQQQQLSLCLRPSIDVYQSHSMNVCIWTSSTAFLLVECLYNRSVFGAHQQIIGSNSW